ncbi:endonuclease [Mangrovimonas aestuarii]|uniref:endonuclease n=1 Tax=Mangrovimonas aestuarii TaxID=3018443 RepID=UPI0023789B40|nr:endonuclease [Mangrovimonas aestuarii]
MKQLYLTVLFFFISLKGFTQLNPPAELADYYTNVSFSRSGNTLYEDLAAETIAKHSVFLDYAQRHKYLYIADKDLSNSKNVILIYSGESRSKNEYQSGINSYSRQTFNTEHIYPQSLINNTAKGDLHHLRSCDIRINSRRGNKPYTNGSGSYTVKNNAWYPGDEWKGDVARMILYMNLRYNESINDVGDLELFLQWNAEDPVSPFEEHRNNEISKVQGNRNPFIDNPYLATVIWGGPKAENKWGSLPSKNLQSKLPIKIYPNPVNGEHLNIETDIKTQFSIYNILGKEVLYGTVDEKYSRLNISNLSPGVYLIKLKSTNGTSTKKLVVQ